MPDDLSRFCDTVLRASLPAGLTASIRRLLEAGEPAAAVLAACRQAGATRDTLTGLAVEAEVLAIVAEMEARRN